MNDGIANAVTSLTSGCDMQAVWDSLKTPIYRGYRGYSPSGKRIGFFARQMIENVWLCHSGSKPKPTVWNRGELWSNHSLRRSSEAEYRSFMMKKRVEE